jgi:hypothetical protein
MTRFEKTKLISSNSIKQENEKYLHEKNVRISDWLPEISHVKELKPANEIAERAAICLGLYNLSLGEPTDAVGIWLEDNNLSEKLCPHEQRIIAKKNEDLHSTETVPLRWSIESCYALMCAGSLVNELDPAEYASETLLSLVPSVIKHENVNAFIQQFHLRPYAELHKARDLYFRLHWYVETEDSQIFNLGVIQSRREALEWIFDIHSDWDSIDLHSGWDGFDSLLLEENKSKF